MISETELSRWLRELADDAQDAGPWDDPLPAVWQRAGVAAPASTQRDQAAEQDPTADAAPVVLPVAAPVALPVALPVRFTEAPSAPRRGRSTYRTREMLSAAAVVVGVVGGLGLLVHHRGHPEEAATSSGQTQAAANVTAAGVALPAATAALPTAAAAPTLATAAAGSVTGSASCVDALEPTSGATLTLHVAAEVQAGATLTSTVTADGSPAQFKAVRVDVYAARTHRLVGVLGPAAVLRRQPGAIDRNGVTTPTGALRGVLRTATCSATAPTTPTATATALPPGRYELVAVGTVDNAGALALHTSRAVTVTVTQGIR